MAKDFSLMEDSNRSANQSIHEVSAPARRTVLQAGGAAGLLALLAPLGSLTACAGLQGGSTPPTGSAAPGSAGPLFSFKGIPADMSDRVVVPAATPQPRLAPTASVASIMAEVTRYKLYEALTCGLCSFGGCSRRTQGLAGGRS